MLKECLQLALSGDMGHEKHEEPNKSWLGPLSFYWEQSHGSIEDRGETSREENKAWQHATQPNIPEN